MTIQICVRLENRNEYIPMMSVYGAIYNANRYKKCADVKSVYVIDTETGEMLFCYEREIG